MEIENHIDYETIETANGKTCSRIAHLYTPKQALQHALHIHRAINRQIAKIALDTVKYELHYVGARFQFKLAHQLLPWGIFDFDKMVVSDNIFEAWRNYLQGKPANDPLYNTMDKHPVNLRMWLYSPKQMRKMDINQKFFNIARIHLYRAIIPILRKYQKTSNSCYTWSQMANDCYSHPLGFNNEPDKEHWDAYGVVDIEHSQDDKHWVHYTEEVTNQYIYRHYQSKLKEQGQFRDGKLKFLDNQGLKRVVSKRAKEWNMYGVGINQSIQEAEANPDLVVFQPDVDTKAINYTPVITDPADVKRYQEYTK